ncbi:MAG TPA: 2-oxoacid:acceptor oxidoreductase [Erysipelotrichaceae bacterium]|nr:2-oxoacid:acceptor oxidoreductase [Erysipelotrichaceae bacterium]
MDDKGDLMRGEVLFNTDRCKGCSLCVQACPVHILALDTTRVNAVGYNPAYCFDMSKCIACTNCATMCPDTVITVKRLDV